ncbi:glycosyltransferase [Conexibacter sp. DBS9H8]|uniref:glycosyltransferase n=1 Tax=Conexibacter sp. DBS9H8 TaxID=2937801 RepID=UPI00200D67F3|nr:glycosyltransferase [Conexibacter sp. DBS9H8]
MLAPVRAALLAERPDLILREPSEYATAVVAHQAGLPHAQVGISLSAVEGSVLGDVADVLDGYGAGTVAAIRRAPYLTAFPSSLDPSPWRDTRRYRLPRLAVPPLPDWWDGDERPLILLSFGTVFGRLPEAVASYRTAIAALAGLPVRVLVTVGRDGLSLGPQPANVRVEPWVAQDRVLGVARLVVCHGGSGTTYGALAAGVPVVVCPFFADQGANAERVARSGAGRVYVPRSGEGQGIGGLTGADIAPLAAVVAAALADEHHRAAALRIASEVTGAPSLDDVLGQLLEEVPGMSGTEGPRPT